MEVLEIVREKKRMDFLLDEVEGQIKRSQNHKERQALEEEAEIIEETLKDLTVELNKIYLEGTK